MIDQHKTKAQLLDEIVELRRRVVELEQSGQPRSRPEELKWESFEIGADVFRGIPAGVLVYQYQPPGELFLVSANPEAGRLTGITVQEWRGSELDEMWPNARKHGLTEEFLSTMKSGKPFETNRGVFAGRISRSLRIKAFKMPADRLGVVLEETPECLPSGLSNGRANHSQERSPEANTAPHPTTGQDQRLAMERTARAEEMLVHSERMKALGEMAGAAAHSLTNLLQIVVGGTRTALSNLEWGKPADVKANLDEILENLRSAAETARLLHHFAGARRDKAVQTGRIFDLARTVERAVEMSLPWLEADLKQEGINVSLRTDIQPGCMTKGVENELLEVVLNLVWNAAEALPEGGEIHLGTHVDGENVMLYVQDNGIGIHEENIPKIFQPFWTTKPVQGTGLGLSSSYGIVCRHGGDIAVESRPGEGTVFFVKLPLAEKAPEAVEVKPPAEQTDVCRRVLVVDDLEPLVRLLKMGLIRRGQKVLTAVSGREAIDVFLNNEVDVVICDLGMPDMNGWQVAARIKEICRERGIPKIPFVLLTGWGGQLDQEDKITESGVNRVLEKPADIPKLLAVIHEVTGNATHPDN